MRRASSFVVDFKGKAECADRLRVTTREQVRDYENSIFREPALKIKELVSAEGIEPSTY